MIKRELIKEINTFYYRNLQHTDFKLLNEDCTIKDINNNKGYESQVDSMLEDLVNCQIKGNKLISKEGIKIQNKILIAEARVKNSLFSCSETTREIMSLLSDIGDSYIVGGFIRDSIANKESNDIDFCTSVEYSVLIKLFEDNDFIVKETGKNFLVITITKNNESFEIAQLRSDKDNSGATIGTIYEDAARRDFTNSAIYWDLSAENLIDPNGNALNDILDNKLKFIGKPKDRLIEDPLRSIRFFKFIQRGWDADPKTLKSVRENFDWCLKEVNSHRVLIELEKIVGLR